MWFRGREMAHTDIGRKLLDRLVQSTSPTTARSSSTPLMEGTPDASW